MAKGRIWLVASAAGFVSWCILILLRLIQPTGLLITTQITRSGLPAFTAFQITPQNWIFAFLLVTVLIAVILFETRYLQYESNLSLQTLAGSLILTATGLLAVLANSDRAFAVAWGIFDLIELSIIFIVVKDPTRHTQAIRSIFFRIFGLTSFILLMVLKADENASNTLLGFSNPILVVTLITVLLRSGVVSRAPALSASEHFQRGAGTLLRVIPPVAVLAFLTYSLPLPLEPERPVFWLLLITLLALIGAINWINSENELIGRPDWFFVVVMLAISAAIKNQPGVLLSLGVLTLSLGPLLTLTTPRTRLNQRLIVLPLAGFMLLPFTPSTPIVKFLMGTPFQLDTVFYGLAYFLLLIGYLRHVFTISNEQENSESWMKFLHVFGLFLLGISAVVGGLLFLKDVETAQYWWFALLFSGFFALASYLFFFSKQTEKKFLPIIFDNKIWQTLIRVFSKRIWTRLAASVINWLLRLVKSLTALVQQVLEGDGGIFWSLLFLVLLASLLLAKQVP